MCAASFDADEKPGCGAGDAAAQVLNDIKEARTKGSRRSLGSAECVGWSSMLKGGFYCGSKYGRGLASCRTPKDGALRRFFFNGAASAFRLAAGVTL